MPSKFRGNLNSDITVCQTIRVLQYRNPQKLWKLIIQSVRQSDVTVWKSREILETDNMVSQTVRVIQYPWFKVQNFVDWRYSFDDKDTVFFIFLEIAKRIHSSI